MGVPIVRVLGLIRSYRSAGPLARQDRLASGVAGISLVVSGLRRGGLFGVAMAAVGADLVYRGVRGEGHIYELIHAPEAKMLAAPVPQRG